VGYRELFPKTQIFSNLRPMPYEGCTPVQDARQ
jgi:hypothetical protein